MSSELAAGSKVAIIGGGIAGAAMACSVLQNARSRNRAVEVRLYQGGGEGRVSPPAVLTAECRSRLAGLGCRVPQEWRALELRGIEVIAQGQRSLLEAGAGTLWVVDRWAAGLSGTQQVTRALTQVAVAQGVRLLERSVDRVEDQPTVPGVHQLGKNPGDLVVRAGGGADRFHSVVLAGGASAGLRNNFFEGFQGAPTLPAVHARLRHGVFRTFGAQVARLILAPLPGVDALFLLPGQGSTYALAYGPTVSPADLCQAVMAAARDGLVTEGFELASLEMTRVPYGAGTRLTARGRLAVGAAAFGHPLQLGISDTLASCTRAAVALVEVGGTADALRRRYVGESLVELLEDANDGARAVGWLRKAGRRAPAALQRARDRARPGLPFSGGILGLPTPSPKGALSALRRAAFVESLVGLFLVAIDPLPASAVVPESDLYYVVDDDPDAREALSGFLESQGAQVVAFADELSLFAAVARRPPSAILLDVVLNWVDGLRLCEGLKQHPLTRATPVYVMSGLDRPHIKLRAREAGAEAFIPKPFDPARILAILRGMQPGVSAVVPAPEPRPSALTDESTAAL
ncbi:MAG: response regulator [Myxococcota bacterium]|nr:response regulator [Myxococcota bacterium]